MSSTPSSSSDYASRKADRYPGGDSWADHRTFGEFGFTALPDLADRRLGGSVIAASDEFFAIRENLINPQRPEFTMGDFGPKGQIMDGWETRRRRGSSPDKPLPADDEHDWAIVRLGAPGVVRGVVVDTAHFRGNFAPAVSVEGAAVPGTPSAEELAGAAWQPLLTREPMHGHAAHGFAVAGGRRFTHLRLSMFPDGGIARLRVHGDPLPDPSWLDALGAFDTAALLNGGTAAESSDSFYSDAGRMLHPGLSGNQADGWETGRRREGVNDWAVVTLTAQAELTALEIDTAHLIGNSPGWAAVFGRDGADGAWFPVLEATALQPDTLHRLALPEPTRPVTHLRVDIHPCGGIARFRAHGRLTAAGRADLQNRWDAAAG